MSDIYSTLQVSPKKRRQPSPDHTPFTPKKLRAVSVISLVIDSKLIRFTDH